MYMYINIDIHIHTGLATHYVDSSELSFLESGLKFPFLNLIYDEAYVYVYVDVDVDVDVDVCMCVYVYVDVSYSTRM